MLIAKCYIYFENSLKLNKIDFFEYHPIVKNKPSNGYVCVNQTKKVSLTNLTLIWTVFKYYI